jgi:hypothetical protein
LLQRRFGDDFSEVSLPILVPPAELTAQKIVSTDDYMPMTINSPESYDEVLSATWFVDDRSPEEITYVARPIGQL